MINNPHQAKRLLAEAGYPEGQGLPVIDLWYNSKEETALSRSWKLIRDTLQSSESGSKFI